MALRTRLGLSEGDTFDQALAGAVKEFQVVHGLKADGIAGAGTIDALNKGAEYYEQLIIINMESAKRLPAPEEQAKYAIVDAGDARLSLWENGRSVAAREVAAGDLHDNGWVKLPVVINNCQGKRLLVRVESADARVGDAVTAWTYPHTFWPSAFANTIFMATVGLAYILEGSSQIVWGTQPKGLDVGLPPDPIIMGGVFISQQDLYAALASGAFVARRCHSGRELRLPVAPRLSGSLRSRCRRPLPTRRAGRARPDQVGGIRGSVAGRRSRGRRRLRPVRRDHRDRGGPSRSLVFGGHAPPSCA